MFSHFLRPAGDGLAHDVTHLRDLVNAHEGVHLGHELGKFLAEALRKTARNDDGLTAPVRVRRVDPAGAGAVLGWLATVAVLAAIGWAAVTWRTDVIAAWPPSQRVYAALGLR